MPFGTLDNDIIPTPNLDIPRLLKSCNSLAAELLERDGKICLGILRFVCLDAGVVVSFIVSLTRNAFQDIFLL